MSEGNPCIFCEIVAGRALASMVYEDERVLAFMDLHPVTEGHLLIVPKAHYRNVYDCPPEVVAYLSEVGARLAGPLRRATGCQGMNFHIANEAVAGQDVWHIHLHLLPRYTGDGFGFRRAPGSGGRATRQALDEVAARIAAEIRVDEEES
jgi:diadenosine tetraphosphate (Ap4A) HIT family hydrolase